jgi:hypothetical protein
LTILRTTFPDLGAARAGSFRMGRSLFDHTL